MILFVNLELHQSHWMDRSVGTEQARFVIHKSFLLMHTAFLGITS